MNTLGKSGVCLQFLGMAAVIHGGWLYASWLGWGCFGLCVIYWGYILLLADHQASLRETVLRQAEIMTAQSQQSLTALQSMRDEMLAKLPKGKS